MNNRERGREELLAVGGFDPEDDYDTYGDDDADLCPAIDPVENWECCREAGHPGPHQSQICNGTCDTCSCVEWRDES